MLMKGFLSESSEYALVRRPHASARSTFSPSRRDDQPHGHRITWPPPGPVDELDRAARDDRAGVPVAADELETIAGPHHPLHNELDDGGPAAGNREDIVDLEAEPARGLAPAGSLMPLMITCSPSGTEK
jgi:hypothetical protein